MKRYCVHIFLCLLLSLTSCHGRREDAGSMNDRAAEFVLQMDYPAACSLYNRVIDSHANHLESMVACVGLMDICQRISDNIGFYEFRNQALLESRGLMYEADVMNPEERFRFERACNELRLISARYYYELEQKEQASDEFRRVLSDDFLRRDTVTYVKWLCLRGMGVESDTLSLSDRVISLGRAYRLADASGYETGQASALETIASLIMECDDPQTQLDGSHDIIRSLNKSELSYDVLPEQMFLRALQLYLHNGAVYESIGTYNLMASLHIRNNRYEQALDCLNKALGLLNDNMLARYGSKSHVPPLEPFRRDGHVIENYWIENAPLAAVPEYMGRLRELMGLAFSGLDEKVMSDYNRNVFLELQKTIRLDRRYEARNELLTHMERRFNTLLYFIVGIILVSIALFIVVGNRLARRNTLHTEATEKLLGLFEDLMTSEGELPVPVANPDNITSEDVRMFMGPELADLVPAEKTALCISSVMRSVAAVEEVGDMRLNQEKLLQLESQKTEESVRQNLIRKACYSVVSECTPLIDRMQGEVRKLSASVSDTVVSGDGSLEMSDLQRQRLEYIKELAGRINDLNDVLSDWIKTNQGVVDLAVSNFDLQSLFDIIARSSRAMKRNGLDLQVETTDLWVKADRALTLFMINTLTENASKFTPPGGLIKLSATKKDDYVEISVTDNGAGMSESDVAMILGGKVYDSGKLGNGDPLIEGRKGGGFGLMNCKGIIEKYRKSGDLFRCCMMGIESSKGDGSRFFFRLPAGVRRTVRILVFMLSFSAGLDAAEVYSDSLLVEAYDKADSTYTCNMTGRYEQALEYARLSIDDLNADRLRSGADTLPLMQMYAGDRPAEIQWLDAGFPTDYETVLWLRNEIAVSALALHEWDLYHYNNDAYLTLFRNYYAEDRIEHDSLELQRSTSNQMIAIILLSLLFLAVAILWTIMYSRHWLKYRSDMQQVLDVMAHLSDAANVSQHDDMKSILDRMSSVLLGDLENLLFIDSVGLALKQKDVVLYSEKTDASSETSLQLLTCAMKATDSGYLCVIPIPGKSDHEGNVSGALGLRKTVQRSDNSWNAICNMLVRYLSVLLNGSVSKVMAGYRDIEQLKDESDRVRYELSRLHVQTLVMDNCLSSLKHETVWYPNRILQLAGSERISRETLDDLNETVSYYREVFGILSQNTQRQQADQVFRRKTLYASQALDIIRELAHGKEGIGLVSAESDGNMAFSTDPILFRCLADYVIDNMSACNAGPVTVQISSYEDKFVKFCFTGSSLYEGHDLESMFTPLWSRNNQKNVICRQIIREHDRASGHLGCKINASCTSDSTLRIWFTLPGVYRDNNN